MTNADETPIHPTGGRRIEQRIEVPGTVAEVWATIATGPGISSWFVPTELEERAGGAGGHDLGPGAGRDDFVVLVWKPPQRVVFRGCGETPLTSEWRVEAEAGQAGGCTVRLVVSGFGSGSEWSARLDAADERWRIFLAHLRLQLTHFRGERAKASIPSLRLPGPRADVWASLCEAMEIPPEADDGEVIDSGGTAPELVATVAATWETSGARAYHLLLAEPGRGTGVIAVEGEGDRLPASVHLYLYDHDQAAVERLQSRWLDWLRVRFLPLEDRLGG